MKRNKNYLFLLAAAMLLFLVPGCGKKTEQDEIVSESAETSGKTSGKTESTEHVQSVSIDFAGSTDDKMFLKEFIPLSRVKTEADVVPHRYYDTYGGKFYLIEEYGIDYDKNYGRHFYVFDGDTCEMEEKPLPLEVEERPGSSVISMDILPDGTLSLRMTDYTTDGPFYVIADMEGNVLKMEKDFPEREKYPWNPRMLDGEMWQVFDFEDGSTLIGEPNSGKIKFSWFDAESGDKKAFGELEGEPLQSVCRDGENAFYCNIGNRLVRWDVKENSCDVLVNLYKKGIGSVFSGNNMLLNQAGEIIICAVEGEAPGIFVFSRERTEREDGVNLKLVRLQPYGMDYISALTTKFFTEHPNVIIETSMEDDPTKSQDFHDRLFVEIAAGGEGPDLMWVSEEDMRILGEKGALMDLTDLIPDYIKAQMFPGVLQLGTLDGKLVGITPECSFESMVTADATWGKDSWTIKEFLQLAEEREDVDWLMTWGNMQVGPTGLMYGLFLADYNEFIDWEQGTCSFDSDEFKRMLEISKKYGKKSWAEASADERLAMVTEGRTLSSSALFYEGLSDFSATMRKYGENCHLVGYPTANGGSGNYIYSEGYLVVNAKAEHVQEIADFIAFLLDYDNQFTSYISSVRKDVSRDCIMKDNTNRLVQKLSNTSETPILKQLAIKPGGGSYIDEYLEFAESCAPRSYKPEAIRNILDEEMPNYFEGSKSADEVAGIIQNRVRLYLMENM